MTSIIQLIYSDTVATRGIRETCLKYMKLFFFTDNLGPEVVYCPPDQNIIATQMKTVVTWKPPQFNDNSNGNLTIICNHENGTEFYWGTWIVHCTAFDNNPNNKPADCQFKIRLKRK